MQNVRAVLKIFFFLISTLAHYSIIVCGNILYVFGFNKRAWSAKIRHKWGQSVCRIMNINVIVEGEPPEPPFFLVSNHLSYVDVWVLFSQLKCTFIAKSEVRNWPLVGFILATSGILFVDRERKKDVARVNEEVSRKMAPDQGIVLFPEGTTSPGDDILPFKSSLFQIPAVDQIPVSCAHLKYHSSDPENPAREKICWWDDTPFFKHFFYAFVMKEFTATVTFLPVTFTHSDRKTLASTTEEMIKKSFKSRTEPALYAK